MVKIRKNRQPRQWSKQTYARSGSSVIVGKLKEGRPGVKTKKANEKNAYGQVGGIANAFQVTPVTTEHRIFQTRGKIQELKDEINHIIQKRGNSKLDECQRGDLMAQQGRKEAMSGILHRRLSVLLRQREKEKEVERQAVEMAARVKEVNEAKFNAMIREEQKRMPITERSKRFRPVFKDQTDKKMEKQAIVYVGKSRKVKTKRQKRFDLK